MSDRVDSHATAGTDGDRPDGGHLRPPGCSDSEVEAAGKVSEALEWVERARGRLYDFHQLIGRADFLLEDGANLLEGCGRTDLAERIRREVIGRNVLPGRWTFQVVEEFDDLYYRAVREEEARVRDQLLAGRRHVFESELKEKRRTGGHAAHLSRPADTQGA